MRILVIGGTRFIGAHAVRALVARGHDVTVFHRGEHEAALPESVAHVRRDAASIPVLEFPKAVFATEPDVVIHMIAMGEADARAAASAWRGRTGRIVVISSGDVYRAYGRFMGLERGPADPRPLDEDAPLRTVLHPYRALARAETDLEHFYEKILVERAFLAADAPPATVLRLAKVYGPEDNRDFASVHRYRHHPGWRWTHAYVENVAHAIALAATADEGAAGRIYNVGEAPTPTVAERLAGLPASPIQERMPIDAASSHDFAHHIVLDSARIRAELGFSEVVSYEESVRRTIATDAGSRT